MLDKLCVIPMTQQEVKQTLKEHQAQDEARAIAYLAVDEMQPSAPSRLYRKWELDRQLIKECHQAMMGDRKLQVTFNNLIGATIFKMLGGTKLVATRRQQKGCGKQDSWEHFLECYRVTE